MENDDAQWSKKSLMLSHFTLCCCPFVIPIHHEIDKIYAIFVEVRGCGEFPKLNGMEQASIDMLGVLRYGTRLRLVIWRAPPKGNSMLMQYLMRPHIVRGVSSKDMSTFSHLKASKI